MNHRACSTDFNHLRKVLGLSDPCHSTKNCRLCCHKLDSPHTPARRIQGIPRLNCTLIRSNSPSLRCTHLFGSAAPPCSTLPESCILLTRWHQTSTDQLPNSVGPVGLVEWAIQLAKHIAASSNQEWQVFSRYFDILSETSLDARKYQPDNCWIVQTFCTIVFTTVEHEFPLPLQWWRKR